MSAEFVSRHLGPETHQQRAMLALLGYDAMDEFIDQVIPPVIRNGQPLQLLPPLSEVQALAQLRQLADQNQCFKSFIGQGYYNTITPAVILRNILENPAWYTAYTPYQPEISQGRLEALLNFQTLVCDLTGMDLANASMLDEATAAAEAMSLCHRMSRATSNAFFVDQDCLPQTIDVVRTRAEPLGIEVIVGNPQQDLQPDSVFGILLQYPGCSGEIVDYRDIISQVHQHKGLVAVAADILSLLLLTSPGELGADVVVGSTQRFGVPMGFGGPHAAYMATREKFKRSLPGRLVGVSRDSEGREALRLALQTREQHIRREKATSNICTSQVLLAVMASMYAVYHGPVGLRAIAEKISTQTASLRASLKAAGLRCQNQFSFDTLTVCCPAGASLVHERAHSCGLNLRHIDPDHVGVSLDESVDDAVVCQILSCFSPGAPVVEAQSDLPDALTRTDAILQHPIFNRYHSETEMLRYIRRLSDRDLALDRAMIPLGSCTMKLNATSEMLPVTWPQFASLHPFVPESQSLGYRALESDLKHMLCEITGYDDISFQPNAGSQGEYAGLLAIRAYHEANGDRHRDVCLIPSSAHGTNPASAQMCGMKVVVTACDAQGNVDIDDLRVKVEQYSDRLSAIMVTYPSTHGVFEERIVEVCDLVHAHGGQVYIDGANLNAMVGLCKPGEFGGDVSHLNLHKTFCIPHGGGGPGVGPVAVKSHLAPFLPGHRYLPGTAGATVSAAPLGSASILPITWMYIRMMGGRGLQQATEVAILNANYVARRLEKAFPVLYKGGNGLVAHECIVDFRGIREETGVDVEDVAKRLIDYGFHAPTMSFPVAGTLMIEPTESESLAELDRFADALLSIASEIDEIRQGRISYGDSALAHAPHTVAVVSADEWTRAYPRSQGGYPLETLRIDKYWPPVGRIDNVFGDRNLFCSCAPVSDYQD